jgi:hypothetical protein
VRPVGISEIKKREYLKDRINDLGGNSKNKNFGDICREIDTYQM